jgi:glutamate/tyrosine decarboxylase-like PLP-dependent enzyme
MISDDIRLSRELFTQLAHYPELQPLTQSLSIATFRYVPTDLVTSEKNADGNDEEVASYLDKLNLELLTRLQHSGEAYLSNAVIHGKFALRACIVNFRTTSADIAALPSIVIRMGKDLDAALRPLTLHTKKP